MKLQKTIWGSWEVVVRYKPQGEEAYNKPLFEGTEEECEEFIAVCHVNRAGDQ